MRTLLLSALLLTAQTLLGASGMSLQNAMYPASLKPIVAGCVNTCSASVFCDKFENAFDATWGVAGIARNLFVSEARGDCSSYFLRFTNGLAGNYLTNTTTTAYGTSYVSFWFRLSGDSLQDGSSLAIYRCNTTNGQNIVAGIAISKTGTQLSMKLWTVNSAFATVTNDAPQNISANTWYHVGVYCKASDYAKWRLTTTDDLGSDLGTSIALPARSPQVNSIGFYAGDGTWGASATDIDFDSFTLDATGYKSIEYKP